MVVFPIHPRTIINLKKYDLFENFSQLSNLIILDPLDYFSFQKLVKHCLFVLTDSGGIQEETTFLQIPCITMRSSTERPITCTLGSNILMPFDLDEIKKSIDHISSGNFKKGKIPDLWDGKATERIFFILSEILK
jgi:UDP-N-acetylglucosamine 2-epimerase (non-hydrolysing)